MFDNEDVLNPRNRYGGIMTNILNVGGLSHAGDSGELENRSGTKATHSYGAKRFVCMTPEPDAEADKIAFRACNYAWKYY